MTPSLQGGFDPGEVGEDAVQVGGAQVLDPDVEGKLFPLLFKKKKKNDTQMLGELRRLPTLAAA